MKPLAIELYAGMFGWGAGFVAEGYRVVGFDIVHEHYHGPVPDGCELVLQDVLTLHGSQFKDATVIVASPPCQAYSYRAMPWKRAKALPPPDNSLFEACFRIQREASEAAGRYIPLVVENVKGAQPWVGRARWHFGSLYLWGDIPLLMPDHYKCRCGHRFDTDLGKRGCPNCDGEHTGIKQPGLSGPAWFDKGLAKFSSRSRKRKQGSAAIARIPFPLAQWIAKVYRPEES